MLNPLLFLGSNSLPKNSEILTITPGTSEGVFTLFGYLENYYGSLSPNTYLGYRINMLTTGPHGDWLEGQLGFYGNFPYRNMIVQRMDNRKTVMYGWQDLQVQGYTTLFTDQTLFDLEDIGKKLRIMLYPQ